MELCAVVIGCAVRSDSCRVLVAITDHKVHLPNNALERLGSMQQSSNMETCSESVPEHIDPALPAQRVQPLFH